MLTQPFVPRIAIARVAALLAVTGLLAACAGQPRPIPVTVPVPETRLVIETREVEKQVLVTATPAPSSAYKSKLDAPQGTLLYPLSGDPVSLDPQAAADGPQALVVAQLYEGLYNQRADGSLTPAAAENFESSSDARVYTVTLRSGLTWADGRPLRAQDYVDGACRTLDPAVGSPVAYLLSAAALVEGAADYASGAQPDCSHVGLRANDERTLQIRLERPLAAFPQILASRAFLPARLDLISPSAMSGPDPTPGPGDQSGQQTAGPSLVGNGPYSLAGWEPGHQLTLIKNSLYWAADKVPIDRIEMPILTPAAELAAYEEGRLHVAEVPEANITTVVSSPMRSELHILRLPGTGYLGFNTAVTPTTQLAFREAVAAAIDKQALLKDVLAEPWETAADDLLPPGISGTRARAQDGSHDRTKVRELLAKAGYGPENPPQPVNIWANREGRNVALAQGIAEMLEQSGIPTRVTTSSWDVYQRTLQACQAQSGAAGPDGASAAPGDCNYNLYLLGWLMDYRDPARFLDEALGARPATAFSHWSSDQYETLLGQARGDTDPARRAELYGQAEQMLLDDSVVMPLFHYSRPVLAKPGLSFDFPPFGPPHLGLWKLPG